MVEVGTSTRRVRIAESLHRIVIVGVCASMIPFASGFVFQSGMIADLADGYVPLSALVWFAMFLAGVLMGSRGGQEKLAATLFIIYLFATFLIVRIG